MELFLLHEWLEHEGLLFFGIFTDMKQAQSAGVIIQKDGAYDPVIAKIQANNLDSFDALRNAGSYNFTELFDINGERITPIK